MKNVKRENISREILLAIGVIVKQKRNRSLNFTPQEKDLLVSLVEKYSSIVESKETNAITWIKKNQMWDVIADEFGKQCQTHRTAKNLKDKYENIKKETKIALAAEKRETYMTGGGSKNVSSINERMAAILGKSATGLSNNVDSDKEIIALPTSEQIDAVEVDFISLIEDDCEEGLKENIEATQTEENIPKTVEKQVNSWSTWNPKSLKQKRSEKLNMRKRTSIDNSEELLKKQIKFFENEEKRAEERHQLQKQELELKIELLKLEKEIKQDQLLNLKNNK